VGEGRVVADGGTQIGWRRLMSTERWFACADDVLARIRTTQTDAIGRAAGLMAEAAAAGGGLHIYDTGHCQGEPLHRAGGLLMMRPLRVGLSVESTPSPKRASAASERQRQARQQTDEKIVELALDRSALMPGDVLIVNSVSGKAALPVQVALSAKQRGLRVIAITNITYSSAVQSQHSSGKRLFEVAEVVIDNCGVVGDAAVEIEGLGAKAIPTSGLTFCYIIWALTAEAIAQMLARGLKPHVYRSVNLPDGEEVNKQAEAEYRETGV
jgi:uncharacterized phosphosugar-binding protein